MSFSVSDACKCVKNVNTYAKFFWHCSFINSCFHYLLLVQLSPYAPLLASLSPKSQGSMIFTFSVYSSWFQSSQLPLVWNKEIKDNKCGHCRTLDDMYIC